LWLNSPDLDAFSLFHQLRDTTPDARNSLGVIFAEEGKTVRASLLWRELVQEAPDYESARKNLVLLGSQVEVAHGETAAVTPPGGRRQTTEKERKPHLPASEVQWTPAQSNRE
jgi:hypothetical protein